MTATTYVEELDNIAESFIRDVEAGNEIANGWPSSNYGMRYTVFILILG